MVTNPLGRIAIGDDFFDREREQSQMSALLEQGNNLLLLAPRRVGKSSLMTRLKEKAVIHGFSAEYLTVPDVDSRGAFPETPHGSVV